MQEAGIPVTYGYISDTHDKKSGATGCTSPGNALGPGDACYVAALHDYDNAFNTWFQRLAADGITPANTEFVIGAEENDQFAGANVGRATQPTPAGCDGVTVACHYTSSQDGELQANIKGLLSTTASSGTQYDVQPQGASIYAHGQPAANDPTVRQMERDTAAMTSNLTYSGVPNEKIAKYQAGGTRTTGAAHADERSAAHADVLDLPDARLLLLDVGGERLVQQRVRLRPRLLLAEHRHHLGRDRRPRGRGATVSTAPGRPVATSRTTRTRRTRCPRRARRAPGSRRPTYVRRCCTWSA